MQTRKHYTTAEIHEGRETLERALLSFRKMARSLSGPKDVTLSRALAEVEREFCAALVVMMDRQFIERARMIAGRDTNPLSEVEMITDALVQHQGVLRASTSIKYEPAHSILQMKVGDRVRLDTEDVRRLANAFFHDLEAKFSGPLAESA